MPLKNFKGIAALFPQVGVEKQLKKQKSGVLGNATTATTHVLSFIAPVTTKRRDALYFPAALGG